MGGEANQRTPPPPHGKFWSIVPPLPFKFMTEHKLIYSDSDFRLIISDYSDFSSNILKEYMKKNIYILKTEFYNYMHFVIFSRTGILELGIYNMLKILTHFFYQGIQKK